MIEYIGGALLIGGSGAALYSTFKGDSDLTKMKRIFRNCGLYIDEENPFSNGKKKRRELQKYRHTSFDWGVEYAFRIPLGMSFEQIEAKKGAIQDGLNNKIKGRQKLIEMDYDGMVRIRIGKDLPKEVHFDYALGKQSKCEIIIGQSMKGKIRHDFSKIPHMIVSGTTRYGKTVFLKLLISSLLQIQPERVQFALFDLKGGLAFGRFENLKQTLFLCGDIHESYNQLSELKNETDYRMRLFREKGIEKIEQMPKLKRIFVIIDEAARLAKKGYTGDEYKTRKKCETILEEIAAIGGALGIHLVFCTQYPTADVLPRQIKQNVDSKLCFRLQTVKGSEVVLDQGGAEKLPYGLKGRAIYLTDDIQYVQVPHIQDEQIERILKKRGEYVEQDSGEGATSRENPSIVGEDGIRNNKSDSTSQQSQKPEKYMSDIERLESLFK